MGLLGDLLRTFGRRQGSPPSVRNGGYTARAERLLQRQRRAHLDNPLVDPPAVSAKHAKEGPLPSASLLSGMEELIDDVGLDAIEDTTPDLFPPLGAIPTRLRPSPWSVAANEAHDWLKEHSALRREPPEATTRLASNPAPPSAVTRREAHAPLVFPAASVVIHPTGLALTQVGTLGDQEATAFAARLSSLDMLGGHVTTSLLQRQRRGPPSREPFGGARAPLVRIEGSGQIALEPRLGHFLAPLFLHEVACFFEASLAAFELSLSYENFFLKGT